MKDRVQEKKREGKGEGQKCLHVLKWCDKTRARTLRNEMDRKEIKFENKKGCVIHGRELSRQRDGSNGTDENDFSCEGKIKKSV